MINKLLYIILFIGVYLQANTQNFVLNTSGLIDKRAVIKINTMGTEVKEKIGVNIYLDVKGDNGIDPTLPLKERIVLMNKKELELTTKLENPYAVLSIALDQKYANILMSSELNKILDRDDILDGYVIPLLAAKDKNILSSKVSAASLNGYAQIADSLADAKNIELNSSIGSQGRVASTIWKVFMYSVVLFGIIAYFIIILREKKYKKEQGHKE